MKRFNLVICIILSLVMLALVGCSEGTINGDARITKTLIDFESVSSLEYVTFDSDCGRTTFAKDHVGKGSYSLRYTIEDGEYEEGKSYPALNINVASMKLEEIENLNYFVFDVYSEKEVLLSLAFADQYGDTVCSDTTKVNAKEDTEACFYLNFDEETAIKSATIVCYQEGVCADGLDIYFDNFRAVSGIENKFDKVFKYGEILSFSSYEDTKFVTWEGNTTVSTVYKTYADRALVLEQFAHSGINGKSIVDITPNEQTFSFVLSKEVFDRLDLTSLNSVSFDIFNEGFKQRTLRVWYEVDDNRTYQTVILNANTWQTVELRTNKNAVEKIGIEFNSTDITTTTRTLIRSVRYAN